MTSSGSREPFDEKHPVVAWMRSEALPPLVEALSPKTVIVFDPPDRPVAIGSAPPGLLVVSARFEGVPMPDRIALVRAALVDTAPVRALCLTPGEFALSGRVPGPVLAAARTGVALL